MECFEENELEIVVRCSKGTYVRTLGEDIGQALGCGGHLTALRRTAIWRFDLPATYTLSQLEAMDEQQRDAAIWPLDCMLQDLPALELDATELQRMAQGQRLGLDTGFPDGKLALYGPAGFVGVGLQTGRRIAPVRLISGVAKLAADRFTEVVEQ